MRSADRAARSPRRGCATPRWTPTRDVERRACGALRLRSVIRSVRRPAARASAASRRVRCSALAPCVPARQRERRVAERRAWRVTRTRERRRQADAVDVGRVLERRRAAPTQPRVAAAAEDAAVGLAERAPVDPARCRRWARAGRRGGGVLGQRARRRRAAPKPVVGVAARAAEVARADRRTTWATWSAREVGPRGAHPRDRGGDHRRREARAVEALVAVRRRRPSSSARRHRGHDRSPGRAEVDAPRWRSRTTRAVGRASTAATVSTCGSEAGNSSGLPCVELVAGGGDGHDARARPRAGSRRTPARQSAGEP